MLFNSWQFGIFLAGTLALYYLPQLRRSQVWVLIAASFVFYSWTSPLLLVLLCFSISVNAVTSYIVANSSGRQQIVAASLGVIVNLFVLGVFKYGALLVSSLAQLFDFSGVAGVQQLLLLPLPVGISFYTFEGISLLVDVYRGTRSESAGRSSVVSSDFVTHLSNTALFIGFFPHLAAGPILKARQYYPQIGEKLFRDIKWDLVFQNLVTGYFLKGVIADNLHSQTSWLAYPYYERFSPGTGTVLLFGYSIQIFADFAGYSLIAIGLAHLLGYTIPDNFNFPYISRSLSEFWRRWHISLSTWLRDYLYIPLGGNRVGPLRTYFNLAIVMFLGGLWHGAAWSYGIWGAYHGLGLAIERRFRFSEPLQLPPVLRAFLDFLRLAAVFAFVTIGWLLFKLPNFSQVMEFATAIVRNRELPLAIDRTGVVLVFAAPVVLYHALHMPFSIKCRQALQTRARPVWDTLVVFTYAVMIFMIAYNSGTANEFIYFQF